MTWLVAGPLAGVPASATIEPSSQSFPVGMRLISQEQYQHAIEDVFGVPLSVQSFAPVRRNDGLVTVGSSTAVVTAGAMEVFDAAAREVAAKVISAENRSALVPCAPTDLRAPDDSCARKFISKVAEPLLRRALSPSELQFYVDVARTTGEQSHDFYAGLEFVVRALLIDWEFLYFIDRAEPDPERPGSYRLDGPSKANRLALLLWDAPPDPLLLQSGVSGELHTRKGLTRQVERMLAAPRLEAGVRAFFNDMLVLEKFDALAKDSTIYPAYTSNVPREAREQTLRIIVDHLVTRRLDYPSLFTTRRTFLTQNLGILYGVPVTAAGRSNWVMHEFPEDHPRAGLLTQIAFLSANSHPGRTSPTVRGRALREVFLCQRVPDPPANVDFSIVEDPNAKFNTARERLHMHNSEPNCAGCHKITDPIGLALEQFDGAGQFRLKDGEAELDLSGELDGRSYEDASGLALVLAENPKLTGCLVRRLYQYGLAKPTGKEDRAALATLAEQFQTHGHDFIHLLREFATGGLLFTVDQNKLAEVLSPREDEATHLMGSNVTSERLPEKLP